MRHSDAVVHIVDDDELVARSLQELVDSIGLESHHYPTAEDLLAGYDPRSPGCGLIDVCLPGMNGLMLQDEMKNLGHRLPLILLTGHADVNMAVLALTNGAFGFLEKPVRTSELLGLIRRAVDHDIRRRRDESLQLDWKARFERLTQRETSVVRMVVTGMTNKEIGRELEISPRTVELHRSRVMEKLEVANPAEIIRAWILCEDSSGDSAPATPDIPSRASQPGYGLPDPSQELKSN